MTNNLKRAIDSDLSRLRTTECERAMILNNALEGKKVKKKVSVAFVLVLALVLATGAALALAHTLSRQYFDDIARVEAIHGVYEEWTLDEKIAILRLMKEYGVSVNDVEVNKLLTDEMSDAERERRIDDLVIRRYGIDGRIDVISLQGILDNELGDMSRWSMDDKIWYNQMLERHGMLTDEATTYVLPQGEELTQLEAEKLAKKYLGQIYDVPVAELDACWMESTYELLDYDVPAYLPYKSNDRIWSIIFHGADNSVAYHIDLSSTGQPLDFVHVVAGERPVTRVWPGDDELTGEQAISKAKQALESAFKLPFDEIATYDADAALIFINYMPGADEPYALGDRVWRVNFIGTETYRVELTGGGETIFCEKLPINKIN